jgi:hypothetical protein
MGQRDMIFSDAVWVVHDEMMRQTLRNHILGIWVAEELSLPPEQASKLASDFIEVGTMVRNDEDMAHVVMAQLEHHPVQTPQHHFTLTQIHTLLGQLSIMSEQPNISKLLKIDAHNMIHDSLLCIMTL